MDKKRKLQFNRTNVKTIGVRMLACQYFAEIIDMIVFYRFHKHHHKIAWTHYNIHLHNDVNLGKFQIVIRLLGHM